MPDMKSLSKFSNISKFADSKAHESKSDEGSEGIGYKALLLVFVVSFVTSIVLSKPADVHWRSLVPAQAIAPSMAQNDPILASDENLNREVNSVESVSRENEFADRSNTNVGPGEFFSKNEQSGQTRVEAGAISRNELASSSVNVGGEDAIKEGANTSESTLASAAENQPVYTASEYEDPGESLVSGNQKPRYNRQVYTAGSKSKESTGLARADSSELVSPFVGRAGVNTSRSSSLEQPASGTRSASRGAGSGGFGGGSSTSRSNAVLAEAGGNQGEIMLQDRDTQQFADAICDASRDRDLTKREVSVLTDLNCVIN